MPVNIVKIITIIVSIWGWFKSQKATWDYLNEMLPALIIETEEARKDGKIDSAEAKETVLWILKRLEADKKIKMNPFSRWIANKMIDRIAKKLPSIKFGIEAKGLISSAR